MKNNSRRIIAIVLLVALALWLVFTAFPNGTTSKSKGQQAKGSNNIEPTFRKEAELAILDSSGVDTILFLDIELAESMPEIQYGMMYRKSMEPQTGMLFIMGEQRRQSFYMKNTYVSLDIIYINDNMEIVSIQKNAVPLDESSLPSEGPASLVLEIKGGLSDQLGLKTGQMIRWRRVN
jgi:uncharacterized membrane protein (UPF0127 family)